MSEQGDAYTTFIDSLLAQEYARRDKINSQATATLTSAGGFLTLSSGLIVFLKGKDFLPQGRASILFGIALGLYLVSGGLALFAAMARRIKVPTVKMLRIMLSTHWTDSEITAKNMVARTKLRTIETLRTSNEVKSRILVAASIAQICAVTVVAIAVYVALK